MSIGLPELLIISVIGCLLIGAGIGLVVLIGFLLKSQTK
jgi:hypothetical protein